MLHPLVVVVIGIAVVLTLMLALRMNAFIALITAAMVVSLLAEAPDPAEETNKIARVAAAFGEVVGKIGIVIAMAAVIGKCLMDSGAADCIVRAFLRALGEKRAGTALMSSGFVLSIPVFFDTVFYLLVPLARSLWRRTHKNYILYVTAIACGGAITHTLVPPTPGPLAMADRLKIDLGMMILMGLCIGALTAPVGLVVCRYMNRMMDMPMRPHLDESETEAQAADEVRLPPLWLSLMPVVLPVLMISTNTFAGAVGGPRFKPIAAVIGDANLALLVSAAIAMFLVLRYGHATLGQLAVSVEKALMSGGVIILITAGGGAFGKMLSEAGVERLAQQAIESETRLAGFVILLAGFIVASFMKFAQGSGTVSMITTSSIFGAMGLSAAALGFHPVYLATAIGAGSLVGSWMNDSGFWIFARMSGLTEVETLRSWTLLLVVLGITALGWTLLLAWLLPSAGSLLFATPPVQ